MKEAAEEIKLLATSLIDYMKKNCHPYTSIIVTDDSVAVVETTLFIPEEEDEEL